MEHTRTHKVEFLEVFLLAILGGFCALFLILSENYNPTAALFPRWVAVASLIFLSWAVVAQLRGKPRPRAEPSDEDYTPPSTEVMRWPAVLALQAVYIAGIYLLGFTVATVAYLVAAPAQLRYRRWPIIAAQAALLTLIVAGSFIWFFHIRLPKGTLWELF